VKPPRCTSGAAPSPIKTPRREKPKYPIKFSETHRDPPPSSTRDWEGPEDLPGTLPERGITTGSLLTTRKKATRSAPVFVTRSACPRAAATTPLVIYYP
jgi:hypothetical protein